MQNYTAPLRDMRFVLHELHDSSSLKHLPGLEEITPDLLDTILEEAAKFMTAVLLPLNASGDAEGCHLDNGVVSTPKGFKEAYEQFIAGGWTSLNCDPAYGGQGLPESVSKLIEEIICGCNLVVRLVSGPLARRIHGAAQPRLRRAQGSVPAEAGRRQLGRHDVPDRAALRHRSRDAAHQGRAAARRQLQDHRHRRSSSRRANTI
jgi:hypothetical protein